MSEWWWRYPGLTLLDKVHGHYRIWHIWIHIYLCVNAVKESKKKKIKTPTQDLRPVYNTYIVHQSKHTVHKYAHRTPTHLISSSPASRLSLMLFLIMLLFPSIYFLRISKTLKMVSQVRGRESSNRTVQTFQHGKEMRGDNWLLDICVPLSLFCCLIVCGQPKSASDLSSPFMILSVM